MYTDGQTRTHTHTHTHNLLIILQSKRALASISIWSRIPGKSQTEKYSDFGVIKDICNVSTLLGFIFKIPGEGNGYPLQYSCLENYMAKEAWQATVHGNSESDMTERVTHI